MKRIGLSGGVGCGKSSVLALLRDLGAATIDTDELARAVVEPGQAALEEIAARFGRGVLREDGRLDRDAMAQIVFSDLAARRALEAIVHPRVAELLMQRAADLEAKGARVLVVEVPLLFETGLDTAFDETVVVRAEPAVVEERLRRRNGWVGEQVSRRVASQMPTQDKARRATHVIDNSAGFEATRRQVEALWSRWIRDASQPGGAPAP